MSIPAALKCVAAPIADLKPKSLILSGAGIVPLGFVAQGDGTVVVKWSSPLDPDNPNESLPVVNGAQYPGQIETIVSSDVDLLFYFGNPSAGNVHVGGGLSAGGGGGGGDATAANQTLALTALDDIYDALQLVGTEATSAQIRDAVANLGDGATLADLAAAFSSDAVVQADILAALEASQIDIAATKAGIDLLVPDLDNIRIAIEALNGKILASAAASDSTANPTTGGLLSYTMGWNGSQWRRVLVTSSQGLLAVGNAGFEAMHIAGKTIGGVWTDLLVDSGGRPVVAGAAANGAAASGNPVLMGGWDGTNARTFATNANGQQVIVGPGPSTPATSVSFTNATVNFTVAGSPAAAQNATTKASTGRLHGFRVRGVTAGVYYLQWHDVVNTAGLLSATQRGLGFEVAGIGDDFTYTFPTPISFAAGITWALSTAIDTYTAAAGQTVYVDPIWE